MLLTKSNLYDFFRTILAGQRCRLSVDGGQDKERDVFSNISGAKKSEHTVARVVYLFGIIYCTI